MQDKYKAVWVSYSSISDFIKCPRSYFLKNIYKNPKTGRKIEITNPALSLGSAIHNTLEPLAKIDPEKRFDTSLMDSFDLIFTSYYGKKGGFLDNYQFEEYRKRGHKMLKNVLNSKDILEKPTLILEEELINAWLSKKENIMVCGKIDWINKNEKGELDVIDFKTSKTEEENSLQLELYALLLNIMNKGNINTVSTINYWYLDISDELSEVPLPNIKDSFDHVLDLALKIKKAREDKSFDCPRNGCFACKDYEKIIQGHAEQVGIGNFNREIYYVV